MACELSAYILTWMIYFFKRTLTFFKFIALTGLVLSLTILLVTLARGYIFNPDTLEFEAGGLLIINSRPSQATVRVGGEHKGVAPQRLLLPDGTYDVELSHSGYRSWHKTVRVKENVVVRARYPFLVPNNVTTEATLKLNSPLLLKQSPDRRHIAVVEGGDNPRVFIYDSRQDSATAALPISTDLADNIGTLIWSPDSSRLLLEIRARGDGNSLWLVVGIDSDGSGVVLDKGPELLANRAEFSSDSDTVYLIDSLGSVWSVELGSGERRRLADNAQAFAQRGSSVFVVKRRGQGRELVRIRGGRESSLGQLADGRNYRLLVSGNDDWRLIVHDLTKKQVTLVELVEGKAKTETLPPQSASEVWFSPGQRYVAMYDKSRVLTYDLKDSEYYIFQSPVSLSSKPEWFDEYHLLLTGQSSIKLIEFDGANLEELVPVAAGFPGFGAVNDRLLYTVGRSSVDDGLWLQISNLK